jgi:hypothetical protein
MKYCSIGNNCTSSTILKRTKLKTESYPFDWIFSSDEMVRHCIEDGFKTFLDKSEYNSNLVEPIICEHEFYSTMVENYQEGEDKKKVIFNHHNPLTSEEDYGYFERCVQRFKDLLKSDESKVFVKIHLNMTPNDESTNLSEAILLSEVLSKHTTNYKLIVLHSCPIGKNGYEVKYKENNLILCNLYTVTKSTGIDFEDVEENSYLDSVFIHLLRLIK